MYDVSDRVSCGFLETSADRADFTLCLHREVLVDTNHSNYVPKRYTLSPVVARWTGAPDHGNRDHRSDAGHRHSRVCLSSGADDILSYRPPPRQSDTLLRTYRISTSQFLEELGFSIDRFRQIRRNIRNERR